MTSPAIAVPPHQRSAPALAALALAFVAACGANPPTPPGPVAAADQGAVVLRTSRAFDGRGGVLQDQDIVVRDGHIAAIGPRGTGADRVLDLTGLTVLPGYIDTHVHIGHHFDENGKLHPAEEQSDIGHLTLYGAENAYRTLMSGVTTLQSLGGEEDAAIRAWIDRGAIPGPRILSSLGEVRAETGPPDAIRAFVRGRKAAGADVVKVFASTSMRLGGVTNLSAEQLAAACGEATAQGLRSIVHAHRPDAIKMAADGGCSQIEHAWLADRAALEAVAKRGMYLGNQIDVLFRNYAENGQRFDGIDGFTLAGLATLQEARAGAVRVFQQSLEVPGLKMVYNTDANAGGHGRNAEEIVANVEQGRQRPMDAVIAATSRAAESLGLGDRIGAIAQGMEADIIALDGDPQTDAASFRRVAFVMRAGTIYRHEPPSPTRAR